MLKLDWGDFIAENAQIEKIRDIRNKISHCTSIPNDQFLTLKAELQSELVDLGLPEAVFDDIPVFSIGAEKTINAETVKLCENLKEKGNTFFGGKKYTKAISCYTKALHHGSEIPTQLLSVLYCNRASAYVLSEKFSNLKLAKRDAQEACKLTPDNHKAHYRLATVYKAIAKYPAAVRELEIADGLHPKNSAYERLLSDCRELNGKQIRGESLDTTYLPGARYSRDRDTWETRLNTPLTPEVMDAIIGKNHPSDHPELQAKQETYMGLQCLLKQQFSQGVSHLTRGAELQDPEAMYNLGVCLQEGWGCKKSREMAMYWWEKAAQCPKKKFGMRNIGVAEALHSIGLILFETSDLSKRLKAVKYFQESSDQGYFAAHNTLGSIYQNGDMVKQDLQKAYGLYKMAADLRCTTAMLNLARLHFYGLHGPPDIKKAIGWAETAVELGATQGVEDLLLYRKAEEREKQEDFPDILNNAQTKFIREFHKIQSSPAPKPYSADYKQYSKEKLRECGTEYAKSLLQVIAYCEQATTFLSHSDFLSAIACFAKAIRMADSELIIAFHRPPRIAEIVNMLPPEMRNADTMIIEFEDMQTRKSRQTIFAWAKQQLKIFPDDITLLRVTACLYYFDEEWEKGIQLLWKTLSLSEVKQSREMTSHLLYDLAAGESFLEKSNLKISTQHYLEYLKSCSKGHRKIAEAYFGIAMNFLLLKDRDQAKIYYKKGVEAEKELHEMFHSETKKKHMLDLVFKTIPTVVSQTSKPSPTGALAPFSTSFNADLRRHIILSIRGSRNPPGHTSLFSNTTTPPKAYTARQTNRVKKIMLDEMAMDGTDKVHEGYLQCMVISLPVLWTSYMMGVVDFNGDLIKLAIYNIEQNKIKDFVVGAVINIFDPYYRLAKSGENIIRVDDPTTVRICETRPVCFYCLQATQRPLQSCAHCRVAKYCSRTCQASDWKELNHSGECKILSFSSGKFW